MKTRGELELLLAHDRPLRALRDAVAPRLSDDPGHDLGHATRVALWTARLADAGAAYREAVAAGLCHDIINVPKDSDIRVEASLRAAYVASELLPTFGFDGPSVVRIADAIRDHSFSRGAVPTTPLGRALQDADRLDALGAIGVMRTVSTGARIGARYFHPDDPWAMHRSIDGRAYTVDHFFAKLLGLAGTMCTSAGRLEAIRRTEVMRRFLDDLGQELGSPRPDERTATEM